MSTSGIDFFFICEMTGEDHKQFGEYGVEDYSLGWSDASNHGKNWRRHYP